MFFQPINFCCFLHSKNLNLNSTLLTLSVVISVSLISIDFILKAFHLTKRGKFFKDNFAFSFYTYQKKLEASNYLLF